MPAFSILSAVAPFLLIGLELYSGSAVLGWSGDNLLVERKKTPGPYWFAIAIHAVIAVFVALLIVAANQ